MQKVYHDDRLYQLTKYHWLLLYECLETFAQGFNEQPVGWLATKYGVQYIDFTTLVRLFFWDTTFLSDHLAKMSRQESRTMLIWPETMGLSAGFKTHPDELMVVSHFYDHAARVRSYEIAAEVGTTVTVRRP